MPDRAEILASVCALIAHGERDGAKAMLLAEYPCPQPATLLSQLLCMALPARCHVRPASIMPDRVAAHLVRPDRLDLHLDAAFCENQQFAMHRYLV
jgi:hypothetical protein